MVPRRMQTIRLPLCGVSPNICFHIRASRIWVENCRGEPLARKTAMMEFSEIVLRLAAATVVGAAIGLNRDLHGKPTGMRTLGLVCLGSALIVMAGGCLWSAPAGPWGPPR